MSRFVLEALFIGAKEGLKLSLCALLVLSYLKQSGKEYLRGPFVAGLLAVFLATFAVLTLPISPEGRDAVVHLIGSVFGLFFLFSIAALFHATGTDLLGPLAGPAQARFVLVPLTTLLTILYFVPDMGGSSLYLADISVMAGTPATVFIAAGAGFAGAVVLAGGLSRRCQLSSPHPKYVDFAPTSRFAKAIGATTPGRPYKGTSDHRKGKKSMGLAFHEKRDVVHLIQKLFDRERKPDEWKRMPREARLDIPGTLHHVMVRVNQRVARRIRGRKITGLLSEIIQERCRESEVNQVELRSGSSLKAVSELRRWLCFYLYRALGIPMAEIARQVGVGAKGVAMAIKEINARP